MVSFLCISVNITFFFIKKKCGKNFIRQNRIMFPFSSRLYHYLVEDEDYVENAENVHVELVSQTAPAEPKGHQEKSFFL